MPLFSSEIVWSGNCVKWTQEMVFNIYHHTKTCLDEKIEIDEKISKLFFLTNFLMSYFKTLPEKRFFSKKRQFFHFILLIHEIIWTHVHRLTICSLDTIATFRSNYRIFRAILRPIKIPRQNGHKKKRVFCQFCKFQSMLVLPGVDYHGR